QVEFTVEASVGQRQAKAGPAGYAHGVEAARQPAASPIDVIQALVQEKYMVTADDWNGHAVLPWDPDRKTLATSGPRARWVGGRLYPKNNAVALNIASGKGSAAMAYGPLTPPNTGARTPKASRPFSAACACHKSRRASTSETPKR